jgi:hypothetical protein
VVVGLEAFAAASRRADRVGGGDLVVVGATDCSWAAEVTFSPYWCTTASWCTTARDTLNT